MRSIRLGDLCQRFGVSHECTPSELKSAFHKHCKLIHPDHAPSSRATPGEFVKLREDYEVALSLRQLGYIGADRNASPPWQDASPTGRSRHHWSPHINQQQATDYGGFGGRYPYLAFGQQDDVIRVFDAETRIKGTCVLIFGTAFFLLLLREFLVATAGTFWAYKPPFSWSSGVIRRYLLRKEDASIQDVAPRAAPVRQPPQRSEFYERRLNKTGISREERDRICRAKKRESQRAEAASS